MSVSVSVCHLKRVFSKIPHFNFEKFFSLFPTFNCFQLEQTGDVVLRRPSEIGR